MDIGERIKQLRLQQGLTQEDLAEAANTTKQTIHKYETGIISNIPASKIKALADRLSTTPSYLMDWDDKPDKQTQAVTIPVFDRVAAGAPIYASDYIVDWEEIPASMARSGEYFGVIIKGSSMEPRICEGDIAIVKCQADVESGDIAIVLVNGENGVCKKILKTESGLTLLSFNPQFEPISFTWKEIEELPVVIRGKVEKFIINL